MIYQPFRCVVPKLFHSTMVIKACNMKVNIQSLLDYNLDLIQYLNQPHQQFHYIFREFLQNVFQMETFPDTFNFHHFQTGFTHYHSPLYYILDCLTVIRNM